MVYLDANIVLRYILCDNEQLSESARNLIYEDNCIVTNEVMAEVVYVLDKVYKVDRQDIKNALFECMKKITVQDISVMKNAFDLFADRKFDFVDCILASQAMINGDEIRTFDKKLENYIKRIS